MFLRHPILGVVTLAYLGLVAWITLGPQPLDEQSSAYLMRIINELSQHRITSWLTYSRVEFLANVAMFVPIGVFFLLLFGRRLWILAVLVGVVLTFGIEFAQLFLPARVPDVRDLVANSAGAVIGVIAALIVTTPAALRDRKVQRLEQELARERARAAAAENAAAAAGQPRL
jgi:glycopeptide antibiotics resistance protein